MGNKCHYDSHEQSRQYHDIKKKAVESHESPRETFSDDDFQVCSILLKGISS